MDREFPGVPDEISDSIRRKFHGISITFIGSEIKGIRDFGSILSSLVLIMETPRTYFDLCMEILPLYEEYMEFWNTEILSKRDQGDDLIVRGVRIGGLVEGLDSEEFSIFQSHLVLMNNEESLSEFNGGERFIEQCQIFNRVLWFIYISLFHYEYFDYCKDLFKRYAITSLGEKALINSCSYS